METKAIEQIQKLIDLYCEGKTSIEEERAIRDFFALNNDLPPGLEQWRNWFMGQYTINHTGLDKNFDLKIISYIEQSKSVGKHNRWKNRWISSAAAAILAFLFYFTYMQVNSSPELTNAEIMENYEIVKELLYFTSSKINQTELVVGENLSKIEVMNECLRIE